MSQCSRSRGLLGACLASLACSALALQPLPDEALAGTTGQDGVTFLVHLSLNDATLVNPVTDSRLSAGFNVAGQTQYFVIRNLRGQMDIPVMTLDVMRRTDGGSDYLAVSMPAGIRFTQFGFDSMSAQSDPLAPVTGDLGRFVLNGTLQMQGQLRFWAQ